MKSPSLFTQYVSWLKLLVARYQVTEEDLRINFTLIKEILERTYKESDGDILLPFNIDPELWREVGADGYAHDAGSAIEAAYSLLSSN